MMYLKDLAVEYAKKRAITTTQATIELNTAFEVIEEAIVKEGGIHINEKFSICKNIVKGRVRKLNGIVYDTPDKVSLSIKVSNKLKEKLNR